MNHPIPGKPRIIHEDMDLPVAEVRRLGDEILDIGVVEDIAYDGEGASCASGVDGVGDGGGFFCGVLVTDLQVQRDGHTPASISATMTFAPSLAKSRAASAPMPWPEPVMMATLPARRPAG